jgi:tRNA pseudouridine38-40 synthase
VARSRQVAAPLKGWHDFRSFETDWPNKVTSVRTVFDIKVVRQPLWHLFTGSLLNTEAGSAPMSLPLLGKGGEGGGALHARMTSNATGDIICMDITADGFLYNMVRSIVGTLVNVGRQKWDKTEVARILEAQNRSIAGSTAPACGLFLVQVWYE